MKLLNGEIDKRVVIRLNRSINKDGTSGIMTYGDNNDYPQIIEKLIYGSQTAKACVNIYSKFISGSGFVNPEIGKIVVGIDKKGKPVTLDRMRRDAAKSLAMFNGVYVHCNENLEKEVGKTKIVPFKNCRFSKEDSNGYCGKIAVHHNWSKEQELGTFQADDVSWFPNFNIESIEANIKEVKGKENFKGQIYSLFFDDNYLYPLSPFDSVYLDMDTEYQIQLFKNRQIRDGFTDKALILVDPPDDEEDRKKLKKEIHEMIGPNGSNVVVLEAAFDKETGALLSGSGFKVEKIPSTINDKLFENWEKSLANNIRKAIHALPAVLIDYEEGKLSQASGEMLTQAVNYYNGLTQGLRESFSELFMDIYSHHKDPALKNNIDWRIKPFTLMTGTNGTTPNVGAAAGN